MASDDHVANISKERSFSSPSPRQQPHKMPQTVADHTEEELERQETESDKPEETEQEKVNRRRSSEHSKRDGPLYGERHPSVGGGFRQRHVSESSAVGTNKRLLDTEAGVRKVHLAGGNTYTYCNKEGFLKKRGHVIKSWKSRYFVVDRWRVYYLTEPDGKMQGRFTIGNGTNVWVIQDPSKPYCFGVTSAEGEKEYILQASSENARQQWMAVISHNVQTRIEQLKGKLLGAQTTSGKEKNRL